MLRAAARVTRAVVPRIAPTRRRVTTAARSASYVTGDVDEIRRAVREARRSCESDGREATIGFVPTMGSLHDGHLNLARTARKRCDYVVASIFVNPRQFAPGEDLDEYTLRTAARMVDDVAKLESEGVDAVFTPAPAAVYPPGVAFEPRVVMSGVDDVGEGTARPGFFDGVATVVTRLFNIVQPTHAFFGQKDGHQCIVVRQLMRGLHMPVEVVVVPTVREANGLAMSSRNVNITPGERATAPKLYSALVKARDAWDRSSTPLQPAEIRRLISEELEAVTPFTVDYVSVADARSGLEVVASDDDPPHSGPFLVSTCVRLGSVRLLDNIILGGDGRHLGAATAE